MDELTLVVSTIGSNICKGSGKDAIISGSKKTNLSKNG